MPIELSGPNWEAITALPQPPSTSQNVPNASAPSARVRSIGLPLVADGPRNRP